MTAVRLDEIQGKSSRTRRRPDSALPPSGHGAAITAESNPCRVSVRDAGRTADGPVPVFCSPDMNEPTIFLIRPYRGRWQCFEAPGVQPYFVGAIAKENAIGYAHAGTAHRHGETRIVDPAGEVERTIPFDQRTQRF